MKIQNPRGRIFLPLAIFAHLLLCITLCAAEPKKSPTAEPHYYFFPAFSWQNDSWNFKPIMLDDPNKPIVDAEINALISRYQNGGIATVTVADPVKLQTGVLKHLFPNFGFYMIGWNEHEVAGKHVGGLASGMHYCLAVSNSGRTTKLFGMSDAPGYGKFLSDNGNTIKSVYDARLIWLAYCDIAITPWHSQELFQVSPTDWRLGVQELDSRLCYYDFKVGADHKVLSVTSIMGPAKK